MGHDHGNRYSEDMGRNKSSDQGHPNRIRVGSQRNASSGRHRCKIYRPACWLKDEEAVFLADSLRAGGSLGARMNKIEA